MEAVDGLPDNVAAWFDSLSLLQGIPFNYLVPDERMLPQESLRFFWLDNLWVDCLLDGAFSIGRVTASDYRQDEQRDDGANAYEKVTGFLLRSDVVSGWPGLLVDAFNQIDRAVSGNQLKLLRMERLSRNVLICLFEGEAKRVEIHQKPEALHFGFDKAEAGDYRNFYKTLRDAEGNPIHSPNISSIPWRQDVERVINIGDLARAIKQGLNSAGFALQMIEGVEKVIFNAG